MVWTDEKIERLKSLWTTGASCSKIAAELGEISRNAVIGKVHRMGLVGRPQQRRPVEAIGQRKSTRRGVIQRIRARRAATAVALPTIDANTPPSSQPITILELTHETCHYPLWGDTVDDESRLYCGAMAVDGESWCAYHAARCWNPHNER